MSAVATVHCLLSPIMISSSCLNSDGQPYSYYYAIGTNKVSTKIHRDINYVERRKVTTYLHIARETLSTVVYFRNALFHHSGNRCILNKVR